MSDKTLNIGTDSQEWLSVFRGITSATNVRSSIASPVPTAGVGHSAPLIKFAQASAIASTLVLANFNSLPLDWAARSSLGGTNLSLFILKQLPILPPDAYLDRATPNCHYWDLVLPRALELTYTANNLNGFAKSLGYEGQPFRWNADRRHRLRSEIDAIYARMYQFSRNDLEWILDADVPSVSFPYLKRSEIEEFGEYRTKRYVLRAFDLLAEGINPDLSKDLG